MCNTSRVISGSGSGSGDCPVSSRQKREVDEELFPDNDPVLEEQFRHDELLVKEMLGYPSRIHLHKDLVDFVSNYTYICTAYYVCMFARKDYIIMCGYIMIIKK